MADQIYKVRDPAGNLREIKGPAGATDDQVIAQAKTLFGEKAPDAIDQGAMDFAKDMPWHQQALAGMGKAVADTGRGVGQLVGMVSRDDVAKAREQDAPLMKTGGGITGDIAGNVAMTLLPGGVLRSAGALTKAAGAAEAGNALRVAGNTLLAPTTIPKAVAVGAGMGLAQPSTSTKETILNTGLGAGATAVVPAAAQGLRMVKAAAEPLYEGGQQQIVGRLLNRVAGKDAPAVAEKLKQAATPFVGPTPEGEAVRGTLGEIVPGSVPTVGQAAGNPGVASLERTATAIEPAVGNEVAQRLKDQNAARIAHVETVAGEPGKREFFDAERRATAEELYQNAYDKGIDITRHPETGRFLSKAEIAGTKGEITKLMQRPAIQTAVEKARELAANEGVSMKDMTGSVKGLDYVKRALDDQIGATAGNEQRILIGLKDRLLTTLDRISPDYAAARKVFADMSKPINQMDIGQSLLDKGVNKVTDTLEPGKFINSLTDKTAAGATGFKKATLEGTLTNAQVNKLEAVKEDLQRAVAARNSAGGPGSDTVKKLAYSNLIDAAGIPTWLRALAPAQVAGNVASRGADALYGRANKEMGTKLAELMLDPGKAAQVMQLARQQGGGTKLLELISKGGSTAGLLASPALVNSQQQ